MWRGGHPDTPEPQRQSGYPLALVPKDFTAVELPVTVGVEYVVFGGGFKPALESGAVSEILRMVDDFYAFVLFAESSALFLAPAS